MERLSKALPTALVCVKKTLRDAHRAPVFVVMP